MEQYYVVVLSGEVVSANFKSKDAINLFQTSIKHAQAQHYSFSISHQTQCRLHGGIKTSRHGHKTDPSEVIYLFQLVTKHSAECRIPIAPSWIAI
jgi:hypothetical protein